MTDRRHVVVDLETTGLQPWHQVTEAAYFDLGTRRSGVFIPAHTLEQADPYALSLQRYHDRIAGRPMDDGTAVRAFHDLLGGDGVKTTIYCANPSFDVRYLLTLFTRTGLSAQPFHHRPIDVEEGAYWLFPDRYTEGNKPGLNEIAEHLGLALPNHHEALADVTATVAIIDRLQQARRALARAISEGLTL